MVLYYAILFRCFYYCVHQGQEIQNCLHLTLQPTTRWKHSNKSQKEKSKSFPPAERSKTNIYYRRIKQHIYRTTAITILHCYSHPLPLENERHWKAWHMVKGKKRASLRQKKKVEVPGVPAAVPRSAVLNAWWKQSCTWLPIYHTWEGV